MAPSTTHLLPSGRGALRRQHDSRPRGSTLSPLNISPNSSHCLTVPSAPRVTTSTPLPASAITTAFPDASITSFASAGLLFGRYTINDERGDLAGSFPLRPTSEGSAAQQITLGHTFASAKWINEVRTSFSALATLRRSAQRISRQYAAGAGNCQSADRSVRLRTALFSSNQLLDGYRRSHAASDPARQYLERSGFALSSSAAGTRGS